MVTVSNATLNAYSIPKPFVDPTGSTILAFTVCANTFVAPFTITNNGGYVQITSAGPHGLTAVNSLGKMIIINLDGISLAYNILNVNSTKSLTINLPYSSAYGNQTSLTANYPLIYVACNNMKLKIPANTLGDNSFIKIFSSYSGGSDTTAKNVFFNLSDGINNATIHSPYITNGGYTNSTVFYNKNNKKINGVVNELYFADTPCTLNTDFDMTITPLVYITTPDSSITIDPILISVFG